ncbi:putative NAD(P)-binding domain superfamily [Helianthus annuus]|nr:putative NAD(P)-binding domain superfamily [Helianthus annuus]
MELPTLRFTAGGFRYRLNPEWPIGRPSKLRFCPAAASITNGTNKGPNRMFILGMGYVGEFVAQDLLNQGWVVSGTCTSAVKKEKLKKLGLDVHVFDANHPELEVVNILNQHTHLLVSIPPCKDIGDPMLQHAELLRSKLNSDYLQWLCYLSTTSVYGDCGGAWVDENYQPKPQSELAKLRLAAEEGWLSLGDDLGLAAHVFRLGGIYGPGRSAIDTITKSEPLSAVQRARSFKKFTSRVHVADICNALNGCIHKPSPGRIYNIVDDDPAPRTEVFSYAHELINEKWPSRIKKIVIDEQYTEKGSLRGEKRVVNARMKKELGVRLIHPSFRTGLQSICDQIHDHPSSSSCQESPSGP